MPDKLIFKLGQKSFGIDTGVVDGVVEVNKVFFLPGGKGLVKGIISLRGDPVTVIDGGVLDAGSPVPPDRPRKIIVVREDEHIIGIDIGGAEVSVIRLENPADRGAESTADGPGGAKVNAEEVHDVDCAGLFNRAEKILSPEHLRVVIADDTDFFRNALKGILKGAGFRVVAEAHNGEEAVEMAEILKPDIVILDVVMPLKNGIDAATEINKLTPRPRIIMCSSLDDKPVVDGALRAGADAYITKPLNRGQIIDTLYSLKDKKR
ncbi:MAG: chemotaxis protein [Thermodesulfobacteriota bacterium]